MPNIKQTTQHLEILAAEQARLPLLIAQLLNAMRLRPDEMQDIHAAKIRNGFRLILASAVLQSLQKRSPMANIEKTAEAMGDPILSEVSESVDKVVASFFKQVEGSNEQLDSVKL